MKTSKWLLILIIATFSILKTKGQSVISSAGGSYKDETISLNFTIGEPLAETYKSGNVVLTQGFQQPYTRYYTQILNIPAGWSGISSYLVPSNKGVQKIFTPYFNDLVILMTMTGVFIPSMGVNTIGDWNHLSGYKIKASTDFNLTITGSKIANPTLDLPEGWSLMPVLSECPVNVSQFFNPAAGNVRVVKEIAGLGIYWPEMGYNTIGYLRPGKAYFVLTYNPVQVVFGNCMKNTSITETQPGPEILSDISPWPLLQPTPVSHTIAILPEALEALEPGTIIGLFDQNGQCHSIDVTGEGFGYLTAFGRNPYSTDKEGFDGAEPFVFKILNPTNGKEYPVQALFDPDMPCSGYFNENGLSAVKSLKTNKVQGFGNDQVVISVYPNPSTSFFNIRLTENMPEMNWKVSATYGSIIQTGITSNKDFMIDLSTQPKGIYYLTMNIGGLQVVRKLVRQ